MSSRGAARGRAGDGDGRCSTTPTAEKSVVVLFFDNEADYADADAVLSAMPATRPRAAEPPSGSTTSRSA